MASVADRIRFGFARDGSICLIICMLVFFVCCRRCLCWAFGGGKVLGACRVGKTGRL